jgi:hypothetical protein
LGGDPVEDAVEVLVLDDGAGIELGVILGIEAGGSTWPLARMVTVPSSASLTIATAPRRRRVAMESSST